MRDKTIPFKRTEMSGYAQGGRILGNFAVEALPRQGLEDEKE